MWYDDPESLRDKYAIARQFGVRGVGPYTFDYLDYTNRMGSNPLAEEQSRKMWEAFDVLLLG